MPRKRRIIRLRSRLALSLALLGLILLVPSAVWAGGHVVNVAPPNGVDDTANLQTALDTCVAYGPGCTLQLAAGTYQTKQLVAYNFNGTFKGMGQAQTTIEALPYLLVNFEASEGSLCRPEPGKCLWPMVILFVDGSIRVSDVSLVVPATNGTAALPWTYGGVPYSGLASVMTFTGQHVTANVDRIRLEGRLDPTDPYFGYNVVMAMDFNGTFPRSSKPFDWYFVSGSFTVRNSSFNTAYVGISAWGFIRSSYITIGGSPLAGNQLENGFGGLDIESADGSTFDISYNESSGIYAGMWVVPWDLAIFVPGRPSRYLIHDNKFIGTTQYGEGMFLSDDPAKPWIQAAAWNNTVEVQDTLSEGIGVYNTKGTALWNNSITGTDGSDAIGLYSSTLGTVINNNVSGFTVDSTVGNAQIYLNPYTAKDLVVCAESSDTVLNQGTDNIIIGCQQEAATLATATKSAAPAAATPRPGLLKGKPWPR